MWIPDVWNVSKTSAFYEKHSNYFGKHDKFAQGHLAIAFEKTSWVEHTIISQACLSLLYKHIVFLLLLDLHFQPKGSVSINENN